MFFLADMCEPLLPFIRLIKHGLVPLIQIGIPIILIILGMFDLGKAVMASKEDEIKSAQKLLIKRVIYAVLIFFVVFIINAIFTVVANTAKTDDEDISQAKNWYDCWTDKRL